MLTKNTQALCFDETSPAFFLLDNVPNLILTTHLPAGVISILIAIFVFTHGPRTLPNQILAAALSFFAYWVFANIIIWGTNRSDLIMFLWSLQIFFEPLVYIGMVYLFYVLSVKQDIPFGAKLMILIPVLFLAAIVPTQYNLSGFYLTDCIPVEARLSLIAYTVEILSVSVLIFLITHRFLKTVDPIDRRSNLYLGLGTLIFLVSFASGNIFGSFTGNWVDSQYGLLGMSVFALFFAYAVVRFGAFNAKLIGAQVLVFALVFLIGAQVFFVETLVNWILTSIAFVLSFGFGFLLIRSVRSEVSRKDELQELTDKLARANDELRKLDGAKSEFISIASHQLRTPLTAIKGYISLILEGTYGEAAPKIRSALDKVYLSNERLIQLVEDLLNISRIEAGRLEYKFESHDLLEMIQELYDGFVLRTQEKGFTFDVDVPQQLPKVEMDYAKIREVISNLIDNSIKYTKQGGIRVTVQAHGPRVRIIISDTGIGIPKDVLPHLFSKFTRGDTDRLHADGTGLGLYVGKNLVIAHGGKIWAQSDGPGKGAHFIVELPFKQTRELR